MGAAGSDELREGGHVHALEQTAGIAARRQHGAGKAGLAQPADQGRKDTGINLRIGEHHAHELDGAREPRQAPDAVLAMRAGPQSDRNVLHAGPRQGGDCRRKRIGVHRRVADRGACRPPTGDGAHDRGNRVGLQRTPRGIGDIEHVGAQHEGALRLLGAVHAGEQ
jgi:hypothetical protein